MKNTANSFLKDFKAFAFSGNVLDLAIGVILAIAFKSVVDSFVNDVLMKFLGALFGDLNFDNLSQQVRSQQIYYGKTVTAFVQFVLVAGSLLLIVKALMRIGLNFRAQGNRECDFCKSFVPVDATKCMYCTSEIEPVVTD